jgi:type I restriction enzyme, S subunit
MTVSLWPVPPSWTWIEASEIARVVGGGTPATTDARNFSEPGTGIPWVTPADLSGYTAKTIQRGARDITEKGLAASGATLMPPGTVLFSSRAPIGYVAIARATVATNQGFKSFVPSPGVDPEFLYYYLQRARDIIHGLASGTTFKEISGAKARTILVPLAPTNEQRRIAEALDSHLSRLDAAVASLEAARRKLNAYRTSVLKAAVEGRLVPTEAEIARREGRSYEPADVLLVRILEERRRRWEVAELAKVKASGKTPTDNRWKAKYKEPAPPDCRNLPGLPDGWRWTTLGAVAPLQAGFAFPSVGFANTGVRLLKGNNVRDGWISEEAIDNWPLADAQRFESYVLMSGDVVLAMDRPVYSSGSRATKVAQLGPSWDGALLLQRVGRFMRLYSLDRRFLYHFVSSERFRRHIVLQQNGSQEGKDLPHVSAQTVDSCVFPLPPMPEQIRIADETERLLSTSTNAVEVIEKELMRCSSLRQAILKWAFEGRLADQDPTEEPADALVARIRAERDRVSPPTTKAKRSRKLKAAS